jgi:fibronectin type 3 domain-containing protein
MIEHTDTGLQGSTKYYYKLQAYNAAGTSAWIGPVTTKTQKTGTPDAPGDLSATIVSPSQVDLAWTDHADDETQFLVQRRLSGSTTWSTIAIVDANVTSHADATVEGGKTYEYRVKAKNAVGASKPTQVVVVTTAVGLAHLQR